MFTFWTLVPFSLPTLSSDLYEILESVRSDSNFPFLVQMKKCVIICQNWPKLSTYQTVRFFFQHPLNGFLPNHRKKIPAITIFGILHTFIGVDIIIRPTYNENFGQKFFWGQNFGSKIPYLQFSKLVQPNWACLSLDYFYTHSPTPTPTHPGL